MDGIEDGGGIHASCIRDELGTSGMDLGELGQVVGLRRETLKQCETQWDQREAAAWGGGKVGKP